MALNGRGGIRTPAGRKAQAGFQDRCNRPLCHPSPSQRMAERSADNCVGMARTTAKFRTAAANRPSRSELRQAGLGA